MADEKRPRTIDFSTFIVSLGSSALIHLGEAPDPVSGQTSASNLPLAQQSIDLLALLQEKTKGNLTREEAGFLDQLLYDLRIRYVEAVGRKREAPAGTPTGTGIGEGTETKNS